MKFLEKIGTNKQIYKILQDEGWGGSYFKFATQKHRKRLMTDVALILWDYCQKHHIPVTRQDFYESTPC